MKFNYIKGTENDFEGAPDWVTHKTNSLVSFYGFIDGELKYLSEEDYNECVKSAYPSINSLIVGSVDLKIIAHREPITEALSWYEKGELPTVGEVCEVKMSGEWFLTEIIGFTKSGSIVFSLPFDVFNRLYDSFDVDAVARNEELFRPLKSKQEQEKEVDELVTALSCAWRESSGIADLSKISQKLYDLGYRNIEGEKK